MQKAKDYIKDHHSAILGTIVALENFKVLPTMWGELGKALLGLFGQ
jgi:hypothetical protein